MCPLLAPASKGKLILFFSFFVAAAIDSTTEANKAPFSSLYSLDVYGAKAPVIPFKNKNNNCGHRTLTLSLPIYISLSLYLFLSLSLFVSLYPWTNFSVLPAVSLSRSAPSLSLTGEEGVRTLFTSQRERIRKRERERALYAGAWTKCTPGRRHGQTLAGML